MWASVSRLESVSSPSWWYANSQAVLSQDKLSASHSIKSDQTLLYDSSIIPVCAAVASILALHLHLILTSNKVKTLLTSNASSSEGLLTGDAISDSTINVGEVTGFKSRFSGYVEHLGGATTFVFKFARLVCCIALVVLSLVTFNSHTPRIGKRDSRLANWTHVGLLASYTYTSVLALISVVPWYPRINKIASRHLVCVLGIAWSVFVYRDLWPLATFHLKPLDLSEGILMWVKLAVLTVAAVVVPLGIPRQYSPVDPKEPMAVPNPEQTASIFSLMMYAFLDPVVFLAYRVPHLAWDQLPPVSDYDYAKHLVKSSFKHLDRTMGAKGHIFFGLMRVYRNDYIILAIMLTIRVLATFASPVGINQLLKYLESGGKDATVRPWVWISWLFLGPMLGSIAIQWYIYTATRLLVRTQAIITQLVFDHALRIRVKAESSGTSSGGVTTATTSPDNASIAEHDSPDDSHGSATSSEEETLRASSVSAGTASTRKGKTPVKPTSDSQDGVKSTDNSKTGSNLQGKINNLVTSDLNNIVEGREFLFVVLYIPLQTILCVWFLYTILGWSAFLGMAAMVVLFPVPGYIAKLIQGTQIEKMKKTDARIQSVTESMNMIRMIKLFGWEPKVEEQVAEKREEELTYIKKYKILELANGNINFVIPLLTMLVTFVTYTVIMKQELTAAKVFSSMAVFDMLRDQLHSVFGLIPVIIQAKVSLDRVDEFLSKTELLDQFTQKGDGVLEEAILPEPEFDNSIIGIRDAAFTWANDNDGTVTPGTNKRNFTLRIDGDLTFKRGCINLIIGSTGSGKTSLLMALLGEMHYVPAGPDSFFNLPRDQGIAYAAQESWVQNETIRDNILFGAPYDEERYTKVIEQCGLARDLTLFEAGDQTEVGEKGLTLSGGQKARITLARAIYSPAEIILLDDVLAALDVHTSRWIVEHCFKGDLIRGRTILLVTHNIAMASPIAEFVVSLGNDGRILSQGSLSKVLAKDKKLSAEVAEETKEIEKAEHAVDIIDPDSERKKPDGKLIVAEEISEGHVGWPSLKMYFVSLGGKHVTLFWILCCGTMLLTALCETILTWFMGYWARQYDDPSAEVNVALYLGMYSILLVISVIVYCGGYVVYLYGCLRGSRSLHQKLINSVLGTTMRWLDMTPTSRIIARCTQDIQAVDGQITMYLSWLLELTSFMLLKFVAVVVVSPVFLVPGIVVALFGGYLGQIYIKAQLSVKREMSNARAPVLGHFGAAMSGLTSIRAYGAQVPFQQESLARIDKYTRAARTFYNLNRWICIRVEALGALFSAALAAYLVYGSSVNPSNVGFSLIMAVGFSGMILWWVRALNEFEVAGNSLERIQQYLIVEQEPKSTMAGIPPAYWPASGDLVVENLSARYTPDGPQVLKDISFHVKSGERVGIVGRTGSGKSSLTLSLLRCIYTEGKVIYDGIASNSINLDALRSNITIIPQVPELLSGSLRQNLDPFSEHDDAVLNDALRAAGLFSLQDETDEGRITLDSQISSGGGNLSVGQRQILALARAIVRQSKLLILDEATSAIDYETDTIIQMSLRKELKKDVTLLTVAHRLQTIMDADKIMVLDAGRIVEFDSPGELLKNEKGMLRALVDESGDREALYAMAASGSTS